MIMSAFGEHFPFPDIPVFGTCILTIHLYILGAWEEKGSNSSLTADLRKQRVNGENTSVLCVSESIFVKRFHPQIDRVL